MPLIADTNNECKNTDNGATDSTEDTGGCEWYDNNPDGCGGYDDDDFKSMDMCCACK